MPEFAQRKGEIGWAVEYLRMGHRVKRASWEDDRSLSIVPGTSIMLWVYGNSAETIDSLDTEDVLADDWELVDIDDKDE